MHLKGNPMSEERAPITFHLEELRRRLIVCFAAWLLGSIISYIYAEDIIAVLSAPAGKLYFLNPAEVFFSYLEVAAFTGFLGTLPIHCYEFWRFLRPALRGGEVTTALWFIPSALLLFYGGSAFAFFWVLPAAIQFFMSFATVSLQPMFSLSAYLSFFIAFLLPFALGFELPLVLLVLSRLGLVTAAMLKAKRRVFILLAFIFAGVVSPTTDMFTQTCIAIPMIVLYEGTIIVIGMTERRSSGKD